MTDETTPDKQMNMLEAKASLREEQRLHFLRNLWAKEIREIYNKSPILAQLVAQKGSNKKPGI